jgi:predicted NUDIX family NTP pyrophosphohydrolase
MVLLVHPGGPYWRNKDMGAWQLPKGLIASGEDAPAAAPREVKEELGVALTGNCIALGSIRQAGGKKVDAFAVEQDVDSEAISSNLFELEWPPGSGRIQSFPEIDTARWMAIDDAQAAMLKSQLPLLDRLKEMLA